MKNINFYYPDLVNILLGINKQCPTTVLIVGEELWDKSGDDPEDCPPDVREMFPTNSDIHELDVDSWRSPENRDDQKLEPTTQQSVLAYEVSDKKAICLILPLLNPLAALGVSDGTADVLIWHPLSVMLDAMPENAKVLMPVPISFLQQPGFASQRHQLFKKHQTFIVEHEHPNCAWMFRMTGISNSNQMATVVLSKISGPITFYRITNPDSNGFRFQIPLLLSGSRTRLENGFIYEGDLDPSKRTLAHYYDSDRISQPIDGIALGEIADILQGPSIIGAAAGSKKFLTASCITADLILDTSKIIQVESESSIDTYIKLQTGDLVLGRKTDFFGKLQIARLDSTPRDTGFDDSVILVRFREGVPAHLQTLVLEILHSPAAVRLLFPAGLQTWHDFDPGWMRDLRIPIEEDVVKEYAKILKMREEFSTWIDRTDVLLQGLILEDSSESIRNRIQNAEKQLKLIYQAGDAMKNHDHVITHYYPRPLSFVWAEYRASVKSDKNAYYERMAKVRKAGETLVTFLALVAASYAYVHDYNALGACPLSKNDSSEGLRKKKGFDFGTWEAGFSSACQKLKDLQDDATRPDFGSFVVDKSWEKAVKGLINIRNRDSHLRLSEPMLRAKVVEAESYLRRMFDRVSFLTDWSFRIVDSVEYNTATRLSKVAFRELHGATIHTETNSSEVSDLDIGNCLYLVNKIGPQRWHLLDPFIKLMECREHRLESTFHLDSLTENKKTPKNVVLRSLEFNSTLETAEFNSVFSKCGMLNEASLD